MKFRYKALDSSGHIVEGVTVGTSESDIFCQFESKRISLIELNLLHIRSEADGKLQRSATVPEKESALGELATLLNAGIALIEAIDSIAAGHEKSSIGFAFLKISEQIRQGVSFSEALNKSSLNLPDYVYKMVAASELTGNLGRALQDAAIQMGYDERIRQETKNALIYPMILTATGFVATLFMFIVVVPKFSGLLKNRSDLPWISEAVLKMGMITSEYLIWLSALVVFLVFLVLNLLSKPAAKEKIIVLLSVLPITGRWLIESEIARWAAVLGILLANRVPILQALELAKQGIKLPKLHSALQKAIRDLRAGSSLADSLKSSEIFPATALNLIRAGEMSAELPTTLKTLAAFYDNSSQVKMKRFLVLLEPIAILFIGGSIGIIMVAIMLAITSINTIPL